MRAVESSKILNKIKQTYVYIEEYVSITYISFTNLDFELCKGVIEFQQI